MNLALRKPMTLAEFLEWEERQPMRYEFDGVGPVAMTGGTAGHADVQRNLAIAVGGRLRGKSCRFYGSDLKFQVAEGQVRYPDGMVVCSPVDRTATVIYDPVIVFEVPPVLRPAEPQDRRPHPRHRRPRADELGEERRNPLRRHPRLRADRPPRQGPGPRRRRRRTGSTQPLERDRRRHPVLTEARGGESLPCDPAAATNPAPLGGLHGRLPQTEG